jgi:hypothetical protein
MYGEPIKAEIEINQNPYKGTVGPKARIVLSDGGIWWLQLGADGELELIKIEELSTDELKAEMNRVAKRQPHKVMTAEEYAAVPIVGWHEVCRDVDGAGGTGIRYLGE